MQLASPLVRAAVTLEDEACAPAGTAPAPRLAADLVPRLAGARGAPRWKSFAPPLIGAAHRRPSSAGPRDAPMCVSSSTTDSAPHAVSDLDEEEEVAVQWGLGPSVRKLSPAANGDDLQRDRRPRGRSGSFWGVPRTWVPACVHRDGGSSPPSGREGAGWSWRVWWTRTS